MTVNNCSRPVSPTSFTSEDCNHTTAQENDEASRHRSDSHFSFDGLVVSTEEVDQLNKRLVTEATSVLSDGDED